MNQEILKVWAWRFALAASVFIGILSWRAGSSFLGSVFLGSVVRIILAFGILYGLSAGSIYWFYKTAPRSKKAPQSKGVHLDIAVGRDTDPFRDTDLIAVDKPEIPRPVSGEPKVAGQVDFDLSQGLPDAEKQAEIVRRMGWGE